MTHDEQHLAPITETSDAVEWKSHLRECGRRALRGLDVDICAVRIPEPRVNEACQRYMFAVDGVAHATTIYDTERRRSSIDAALQDYMSALMWCIGAMLYMNAADADEMMDDLAREVSSARDSLYVLAPKHWSERDLIDTALGVDRLHLPEGNWPKKFAPLSFTYRAKAAHAA